MKINEMIKQKRLELGLEVIDVAGKSGLTIQEYSDAEDYPDEMVTVVKLRDLRKICKVLNIDIHELVKNEAKYVQDEQHDKTALLPLNDLIRSKREATNLTKEALGDRLGFYEQAITDMESDPKYLESWPFELIAKLCVELKIPTSVIIDKLA